MSETVVEVSNLNKVFKDFWGRPKAKAVNGLNFEIKKGQVFGLLGPNGSGKSTTIKMLLGLLFPTVGSVKIFGEKPSDLEVKKRIGYLPEETTLYRYLNPEEILDFYASLFKIPKAERKKRVDQLIEMVGLEHARKRPVGEFSKGMARRIGLAQALINDPDLIILDEPTSGLDPVGCREVKDLIRLLAKRGKTVVLSSHLLADVEDIVDNVIVMYGGHARSSGRLESLLQESDKQTLTFETKDDALVEKIRLFVSKELGEELEVEHPKRSLEEMFLQVINEAKQDSISTYGAEYSGKVAAYLQEEEVGDVLEKLSQADVMEDLAPVVEVEVKKEVLQEVMQEEILDETPVMSTEEQGEEKKEEINDKLSNLL
ncbi:ABC transporter ATP-binding protein [Lentisphaera profundi]|uniref:ABC transporter ATP-binding protein n=1 Tax=Lentisphaera profundi TaxID=1658616 RepID=A0ABY7VYM0_9BACT|nr:ABC transporter ATP-binding protein [Lentisphaera profundi]WDE98369.1 ABC transporter ATP-binding protein [Lentisphaera profundi]